MSFKIGAKETEYKGYRFRSRLEARWAVYFDACGLKWEYEKEGFNLPDGTSYLPDFWLPQVRMWAEVKPDEFSVAEAKKCADLARVSGSPCIMLVGTPANRAYGFVEFADGKTISDDCVVSSYHGYPNDEHRFYTSVGEADENGEIDGDYFQTRQAVIAARSARFEFKK